MKKISNGVKKRILKILLVIFLFGLAIWIANYVSGNLEAQEIISDFGYLGIGVLAFFGGLNFIIPVPATTFVPVFLSSGLSVFGIITALVLGTTVADLIAYSIAKFGREKINIEKIKFFNKLEKLTHKNVLIPLVVLFLWASFVPLPNELLLIPLGLLGFRLRSLILPFMLGNIVHNSAITLGIDWLVI